MKRVAVWIGIMLAAGSLLLTACSTTRVLAENEARLAENKVVIVDGQRKGDPYNGGSLQPYIKQKATSSFLGIVNPLVYIYNWQNGRGGWWDRLCQKVGVPPVIYDPGLLDDSARSMEDHLEYEGWYNSRVEPRPSIKKKRAKVKYDVTLGKRFPIRDISFQIRDTALAGLLAADSARIQPGTPSIPAIRSPKSVWRRRANGSPSISGTTATGAFRRTISSSMPTRPRSATPPT